MYKTIEKANTNAVILRSLETKTKSSVNIDHFTIKSIVSRTLEHHIGNEKSLMPVFLSMPEQVVVDIERKTLQQSNNPLWFEMRKGSLTASKHHDIYTKINTISKSTSDIKPKTTRMVANIIYGSNFKKNIALQWGIDNETKALKAFYAKEVSKHIDFKTEKAGLFISKTKTYIAASPDAIMSCKCHVKSTIEIKCPYSLKDKELAFADIDNCSFLVVSDGQVMLKRTHKYYTQIISQMALTNTNQAYFVVWTQKDLLVEEIKFDPEHWKRVSINVEIFYNICLSSTIINKTSYIRGKCDQVLLEENEIQPQEEQNLTSVKCNDCHWYQANCENINISEVSEDEKWLCSICLKSIGDMM